LTSDRVLPKQGDIKAEIAAVGAAASIMQLPGFPTKSILFTIQYLSTLGHVLAALCSIRKK
jgi:hypothetical protein